MKRGSVLPLSELVGLQVGILCILLEGGLDEGDGIAGCGIQGLGKVLGKRLFWYLKANMSESHLLGTPARKHVKKDASKDEALAT